MLRADEPSPSCSSELTILRRVQHLANHSGIDWKHTVQFAANAVAMSVRNPHAAAKHVHAKYVDFNSQRSIQLHGKYVDFNSHAARASFDEGALAIDGLALI